MESSPQPLGMSQARSYQLELFDFAKENNTIIVLGTGTGKTFISVLLIKHFEHQVAGKWSIGPGHVGSKRTIFLAPTTPLVEQQTAVLKQHLSVRVGLFVGAMNVDQWSSASWDKQLEEFNVLVMTPAIFKNMLSFGFISLERVNLLVLDECHRATGEDPYVAIMKIYKDLPRSAQPRLLGLTASVINSQIRGASKVRQVVRELEKTLFAIAKTATGASLFGTRPNEIVVAHTNHNPHNKLPVDEELLHLLKDDADFKEFNKAMTAMRSIYDVCGPLCTKFLLVFREKELETALMTPGCTDDFKEHAGTKREIFYRLRRFLGTQNNPFDLPAKMRRLLDVLRAFRHLEGEQPPGKDGSRRFSGIVFVKERMTAYVLYKWMNEVSKDPQYNFINCSFIVGHNQNPFGHDSDPESFQMNAKAQRKVLTDFREGIYNLIFATSVIEEGMDVAACNLVVRFDLPSDVRSYTQSKGRARAKHAFFVVLTDEGTLSRTEGLMDNFQETEMIVMQACEQERTAPDLIESLKTLEDDPDLAPYIAGEARVTAQNAISLLHCYCQGFASEPFAKVLPDFIFEETSDGFYCDLMMPLITPMWQERVRNPRPFPSKSKARVYVSMEMCRRLHEAGELTRNLLPRPRYERLQKLGLAPEDEKTEVALRKFKLKTSRGTQRLVFPRAQASMLQNIQEGYGAAKQEFYHLYAVYSRVVSWASKEQNRRNDTNLFDPQRHSSWMGLLLREKLPDNLPFFPIYTRSGEEQVELIYAGPISLTTEEKTHCFRFNRYIVCVVLELKDNSMCEFNHNSFVTPCVVLVEELSSTETGRRFVLNMDVMQSVGPAQIPESNPFEFDERLFEDAVVELLYHLNENLPEHSTEVHSKVPRDIYDRYYVRTTRAIGVDGHPLTPLVKGYYPFSTEKTFAQYVSEKKCRAGRRKVTNDWQPMLEVEHVQTRLEMTTTRFTKRTGEATKDDKTEERQNHRNFVIPEFVAVHRLKATVWRKATSLPSILHRLNRLVVAEKLRAEIADKTSLGSPSGPDGQRWEPLRLEVRTGDETVRTGFRQFGRLMANDTRDFEKSQLLANIDLLSQPDLKSCRGPSPADIMKALSTKHSNDLFDMERSELLGDAFLQITSTFAVLDKYPKGTSRELAVFRQYQVCNRHLLYRAFERDLTTLVNAVPFHARYSFLPPGFRSLPHEERLLEPDFLRVFLGTYGYEFDGSPTLKEMRFAKFYGDILKEIHEMAEEEFLIEAEQNSLSEKELPPRSKLPVKGYQDYKPKVAGDVVEALIGVYVEKCGPVGGLRLLKWLGLDFGRTETSDFMDAFRLDFAAARVAVNPEELIPFNHHVDRIEQKLGYVFHNKLLALQAITHASCEEHHLIEPNCRLAFLGEAVLDFLITVYIYKINARFDPGQLTDLRSALTNSQILAHAVVKNELHTSLLYANRSLFTAIKKYVENIEEMGVRLNTVLGDWETDNLEEATVPRSLARMLEALFGAVFLDSGKSFDCVWKIIVEVMGYEISVFSTHIPISPIRELCQQFPGTSFKTQGDERGEDDGQVEVIMYLRLPGDKVEVYKQKADSKKLAKTILAKKYLRKLEREKLLDELKQRKKAGGDLECVRTLEDALLNSEVMKSKYYRKRK